MGAALCIHLFCHDFQHDSGTQFETIPEQQALFHALQFPDTVRILGEQLLLGIRHGVLELFLVSADQLKQLLVFLAGGVVIFRRFNITVPELFQNAQTATS